MAKALDWNQSLESLWKRGYGRLGTLLSKRQCEDVRALYQSTDLFRSRVDMARYRFGRGEYQYFANPLPNLVERLRHELYSQLSGTATQWTLLLLEQQPRAESIGHSIRLQQGEAAVITTRYRPVKGSRGFHRTNFRHGVSPLLSGERYTLGIIFHDAA